MEMLVGALVLLKGRSALRVRGRHLLLGRSRTLSVLWQSLLRRLLVELLLRSRLVPLLVLSRRLATLLRHGRFVHMLWRLLRRRFGHRLLMLLRLKHVRCLW